MHPPPGWHAAAPEYLYGQTPRQPVGTSSWRLFARMGNDPAAMSTGLCPGFPRPALSPHRLPVDIGRLESAEPSAGRVREIVPQIMD